jgi:ATP-dependent DNA helicase DinG
MDDYLSSVFGPDGLLAARFPGYEMRPGQVALAQLVDRAMRDRRHALAEGPCGLGKGVSYAVPAIWHAHHRQKRVVIVTANIALQEQLVRKDLPMLAEVLPWPFRFALLKGRYNFVCRSRLLDTEAQRELHTLAGEEQLQADDVLAWARETATGDVSELPFVPSAAVWSRLAVSSDECHGSGCPHRGTCFSERAMAVAQDADLIVTNYHLLFAHLALRRATDEDLLLPTFDCLILDEAHAAADIARDFFGFSVSELAVKRLARAAEALGAPALGVDLRREAAALFDGADEYARSPSYRTRLAQPDFVPSARLLTALEALGQHAVQKARRASERRAGAGDRAGHDDEADPDPASVAEEVIAKARSARRQAQSLGERVREAVSQSDPNKVYFLVSDAKGRTRLGAKVIDVAEILCEELFARTPSVTLLSATMTTGGTFDFIRREIGAPADALELIAESPFDFQKQALLIIPRDLPDPRAPEFVETVTSTVKRVIDACDGRTLGLFTSYKNLNAVYDGLAGSRHRILRQGELPRTELARQFKTDIGSVLLGTESFWTGIDVPGPALTALVIDKLPFPHVDDPVVSAICARDPRAFFTYMVPRAIIMLRQGVGRLIRSQTDVGVVVILDRRIADKPYGKRFLRSLPPMMTTRRLDNIKRFLEEAAGAIGG